MSKEMDTVHDVSMKDVVAAAFNHAHPNNTLNLETARETATQHNVWYYDGWMLKFMPPNLRGYSSVVLITNSETANQFFKKNPDF